MSANLPDSLRKNPDLDSWLQLDADTRTVRVRTGKVELGQGITTALALIVAEELDVSLQRIRVECADSARPPFEFLTVGSMSVETSGVSLRLAAAEARDCLLARAAEALGVEQSSLQVQDGEIRSPHGERRTDYWQLARGRRFERQVSGAIAPKPARDHRLVGQRAQRVDMAELVFGERRFVNDLTRPGMLHARSVRCVRPGARLVSVELESVRRLPGVVHVQRDGSFLAVVAEREEQAQAAAQRLAELAQYDQGASLADSRGLPERLPEHVFGSYPLQDGTPVVAPVPALVRPPEAAHELYASYTRPYLMHASIGPSAALARMQDGKLEIHCASQGVSVLAAVLAQLLSLPPANVRVVHVPGPGCYGQNGCEDAVLEAALLARALPGRTILHKWSRQDEHAFEPYGPAMRVDVRASLSRDGRVIAYNHDVYSPTHIGRPFPAGRVSPLLAAQELAEPFAAPPPRPVLAPQVGVHRNAWPIYDFPAPRVIKHLVAGVGPRTSSLRGLGTFGNVFACESMLDELAHAAGRDPATLRLSHLDDPRARAVIEAGLERAGALGALPSDGEQRPRGRGMAFAQYENEKCYAAVFVDVEIDLGSCEIRLLRAVIAADAGQIIDPDGLENQLEGGFVQSASWTLKEEVQFDAGGIRSLDWESYPILRFDEVPPVELVLLDRPDAPPLGAGEASIGPTPAAIANAVFAACGVRLRATPFTPARLRAALYAS
jgi:CO/xanthine dehydrogenase Mo-binding subunit